MRNRRLEATLTEYEQSKLKQLWAMLHPEEHRRYWNFAADYVRQLSHQLPEYHSLCGAVRVVSSKQAGKGPARGLPVRAKALSSDELTKAINRARERLFQLPGATPYLHLSLRRWIQSQKRLVLLDILDAVKCPRTADGNLAKGQSVPVLEPGAALESLRDLSSNHSPRDLALVCTALMGDESWAYLAQATEHFLAQPEEVPLAAAQDDDQTTTVIFHAQIVPTASRTSSTNVETVVDPDLLQGLEDGVGALRDRLMSAVSQLSDGHLPSLAEAFEEWGALAERLECAAMQLSSKSTSLKDLRAAFKARVRDKELRDTLIRCQAIRHVSDVAFSGNGIIQTECKRLLSQFTSGSSVDWTTEMDGVRALIHLVEAGITLNDEEVHQYAELVRGVFGGVVASAAGRARLGFFQQPPEEPNSHRASESSRSNDSPTAIEVPPPPTAAPVLPLEDDGRGASPLQTLDDVSSSDSREEVLSHSSQEAPTSSDVPPSGDRTLSGLAALESPASHLDRSGSDLTHETPPPSVGRASSDFDSSALGAVAIPFVSIPVHAPTAMPTSATQESGLADEPREDATGLHTASSELLLNGSSQEGVVSALLGGCFTDEVGELCRPIWKLLCMGKPALAYHYSSALRTTYPAVRVPPDALIRSVALAPGLAHSDGPLAMMIGEYFIDIEPEWFEPGDGPSNWHTALNLLLIAATLRPMILAPAMGASAIARYRHLDGRHSAVLELVRKVGELSEPLTGFAIGPAVLGSTADEASQKARLTQVSKDAEDWLYERAPNKKIRFAPASKVWSHWLRPGELIYRLVSPIARGAIDERMAVRAATDALSDYDHFVERLRDTDRRQLKRRGQDIEAGALEHLWIATCEAIALANEWLAAADLHSDAGGRLRVLVGQLKAAFDAHADAASTELTAQWEGDEWDQVAAASQVLRSEIQAIADLFRQSIAVPVAEYQPKELLVRDLLWVPGASIGQGWSVESEGPSLLEALDAWCRAPVETVDAFEARVQMGDLVGAEILLASLTGSDHRDRSLEIERAKDMWVKDLQRQIQAARRASEVGLAYGYLSDAERSVCESELSAVEADQRDSYRFDAAQRRVELVNARIERQKASRVEEARRDFECEKPSLSSELARQVEIPLARSDIHTFNELLERVRKGVAPWPELEDRKDAFHEFFPRLQTELHSHLAKLDTLEVDKLIRVGGSIGELSFDLEGDDQARLEAEAIYRIWATSFSRRNMSRDALRKVLESLGFTVRTLEQDRLSTGWMLQANPIDDREICPVPHFGSRAHGRYRVMILSERLTPEDLIQRIGESSQQTATIVLTLARSPLRFWPDLARLSKERQRSFLVLDESMLLVLLTLSGSRLATWFGMALPFTYSEPYDASAGFVPPEMFYGRTSELESIKSQGGCYFIYGGRQLGKTALLRRAEKTFHDPQADRFAVWVDLLAQGIGERRPAADVWLSVSDKLRELKIAGLETLTVNTAKSASIDAFISAIKSFLLAKTSRRILLLLDEADHFFEQDERQESAYAETRRLKQLMDETERRFKVVFAGLHNVLRTASTSNQPLGHLNEAVRIGPLMDEREIRAAEELITRPIKAAGFEFEDRSLVMRVLAQTNYYPSLIQLYCSQLLRHMRETRLRRRDMVGPRFRIDEVDIESVFAGRPLRDAIRSKFRLTLQLDDRYEVIAYAIGLEALAPGFNHAQGIDWRTLWQDCANSWWPEGFAATSERDFLMLLEEMVELGVLSPARTSERFSLRNPNVLLLLGSKQEIENTLEAEREPRIEFESTVFRPALGGRVDDPARNPLTYRQLDEVVQMRNSVLLLASSEASGGGNLMPGLRDQPGMADTGLFVLLDRATDKKTFTQELDKEAKKRATDGVTVMLVPETAPWDADWVSAARTKLKALKSVNSFVSVVFVADPARLWALASYVEKDEPWSEPWLSVLPWTRGFVRKWLEELQLPTDAVDQLQLLTGNWGGLLESAARVKGGALEFVSNLDGMTKLLEDASWRLANRRRLTGGIEEAEQVLAAIPDLGDEVTESDLVEYGELSEDVVKRTFLWAEPLGLVTRQAGGTWALEPFFKRMLKDPSK